jgi:hypothetical protein
VISRAKQASKARKRTTAKAKVKRDSRLPLLDILDSLSPQAFSDIDTRHKARVIEEALTSFGVPTRVAEIKQR